MKVYPLKIYALPGLRVLSLIAIVGTVVSLYRHGRDMGALARGAMALLFLAGVAVGAMAFLGLIPKEAI